MHGDDGEPVLNSVLRVGQYRVRYLTFTRPELLQLWQQIQRYRTLFSDLTRGDFGNFMQFVTSKDTFWLEVLDGRERVGIVALEGVGKLIDAEAHVLFLDSELSKKVPVCKAIVVWLFDHFPFHRLTVQVPEKYFATLRLVREIGFKQEGRKRQATLVNGRWLDNYMFGLTRPEVQKL